MKVSDQDIINLLDKFKIKDQAEMVEVLSEKGFSITQASLSRRLRKLGAIKVDGIYRIQKKSDILNSFVTIIHDIKIAMPNLIVVHTNPGFANSFAVQLDNYLDLIDKGDIGDSITESPLTHIAGTIAGDDTVLVVVSDVNRINDVANAIMSFPSP